jgi:hypothetical protein
MIAKETVIDPAFPEFVRTYIERYLSTTHLDDNKGFLCPAEHSLIFNQFGFPSFAKDYSENPALAKKQFTGL